MTMPRHRLLTALLIFVSALVVGCGGGNSNTGGATAAGGGATATIGATASTGATVAGGAPTGATNANAVTCDFAKPAQSVTVNLLAYNSSAIDPFSDSMVKQCSKNNVTVQHAPIDFAGQYEKTGTTLNGDQAAYDIVEIYTSAIPRYAGPGKIVPLDDLFAKYKDKYQLGDLNKQMLDGMSYNGHLYGLPTSANIYTMVYRKDIFDKLGLQAPKTYADMLAAAQKIQQSGTMQYPVALPFADNTTTLYEQVMSSQGKAAYYDAGSNTPNFLSPQAEKGWKAIADLAPYMDPQVISFGQPKVQQQLYNGKAALAMMFSGRMADLLNPDNSSFSDKFAFVPPPSIEPGGKIGANISVDGWCIPANTKVDRDILFQLMAASISPQTALASLPAAYPARTAIITEQKVPYAAAIKASLDGGASLPPLEVWLGSVQSAVAPPLQSVITGKTPLKDGLNDAQNAAIKARAQ
jgi:multiple sugar transport system substrate-binding protein